MFKKSAIVLLLLIPAIALAQHTPKAVLPTVKGKVYYETAVFTTLKGSELRSAVSRWVKTGSPYPDAKLNPPANGAEAISGTGIFKIPTSDDGHYYWLRFAFSIMAKGDSCRLMVNNLYEKPIEPGISNEYSKIEYRWHDYKNGKPWSAEDDALFMGIAKNMTEMQGSLQTALKK